MKTAVFILAGGSGTRLWPLSNTDMPKQFISFEPNSPSFFRLTVQRALKITDASNIFILTKSHYKKHIFSQAPEISNENIFCEPLKRGTAPALTLALSKVMKHSDIVTVVILPSDHYIADENLFVKTIHKTIDIANSEKSIVTIGISPTRPDSSFGYIRISGEKKPQVYIAEQFKEKPDPKTAIAYLRDGKYFWNSGIMISNISVFIKECQKYLPDIFHIAEETNKADSIESAKSLYKLMPTISIDYGLLEKSNKLLVVKGVFGWDDIGSWDAIQRLYSKDQNDNILIGNCTVTNTSNCTIISNNKQITVSNVSDLYVINTSDALLICSKNTEDRSPELHTAEEDL